MDRTAGGVLIAFLLPWSTVRLTPSSPPVLVLISRSIVWKDTRRKPAPLLYANIFLSNSYHHLSRIYIYLLVDIVLLHLHVLYTYRHSAEGKHSSFQTAATITQTTYSLLSNTQHGFQAV